MSLWLIYQRDPWAEWRNSCSCWTRANPMCKAAEDGQLLNWTLSLTSLVNTERD